MASGKAVDAVYHVEIPKAAKKLRELFYCAHYIHSHLAHFYALASPDFVLGPDADPAKRNILGVIEKVGLEIGGAVIKNRAYAQQIQEILGGRATHPVCNLPGGVSRGLNEEERKKIEEMGKSFMEISKFSLQLFDSLILGNKTYMEMITGKAYRHETYYMGMVDRNNKVNFYDGDVRVVNQRGEEFVRFKPEDYLKHIGEHVEPWSYLKFPFLKNIGWKGLVDGADSGVYRVNSLARLNATEGFTTPLAQKAYERMYEVLGEKPSHATLAFHWARIVELMYASERLLELVGDPEITSKDIRTIPTKTPTEGVGCVEAPRGTLFHHYATDAEGMVKKVNILVATGHNNGAICMSVKRAAQSLIKKFQVKEGFLNMVEMAFRAYDPCFACATHTLPGQMPLVVNIYDSQKNRLQSFRR